jgi:hypothetical protein
LRCFVVDPARVRAAKRALFAILSITDVAAMG